MLIQILKCLIERKQTFSRLGKVSANLQMMETYIEKAPLVIDLIIIRIQNVFLETSLCFFLCLLMMSCKISKKKKKSKK